jgi:hypothetical protein
VLLDPVQDLLEAEHVDPRGRDLDGEGKPVQLTAQPEHVIEVPGVQGEHRVAQPRSSVEQLHRRRLQRLGDGRGGRLRQAQRCNGEAVLPPHVERAPAGGQDVDVGARRDEVRHDGRDGHEMLAVVQHDQHLLVVQLQPQRLCGGLRGGVRAAGGCREDGRHETRVGDGRQVDVHDAVAVAACSAPPRSQGEARLAHAARAGERDEPDVRIEQRRFQPGELLVAPEQPLGREWENVRRAAHAASGRCLYRSSVACVLIFLRLFWGSSISVRTLVPSGGQPVCPTSCGYGPPDQEATWTAGTTTPFDERCDVPGRRRHQPGRGRRAPSGAWSGVG